MNTFEKNVTVSRGLNYHYYYTPAVGDNITILFLHGFPSLGSDWSHQFLFFKGQGFGVVAPDLLGYGGTAKPSDLMDYRHSLIARDVIDIIDAENITGRILTIGHDWGSILNSRVSDYYGDRFIGFGFLAGGYTYFTENRFEESFAQTKALLGYEANGYMKFFCEADAAKIIEDHFDSFIHLVYPKDSLSWREELCPLGVARRNLLDDKKPELAEYITESDLKAYRKAFLAGGINGPLNWYKAYILSDDILANDNKQIPKEKAHITKPVFLGPCLKDMACPAAFVEKFASASCSDLTVKRYDTGHWVMKEAAKSLNNDLLAWIKEKF
ncbi:alpha/beta-hydrolase [Cylindrobasidium torrendii FP15055 ss-10]|uniref:Alpha/beta-hydrolase n=1 Tax=Cylindrobasidium torrendii FP15055 ss-10 TaxID=1314674 RepID=A0A0D7BIU7_9AGAR|nr:alpha/beta-hydrolase [Cylindrobasidium torrendii FP15055 ss-10]